VDVLVTLSGAPFLNTLLPSAVLLVRAALTVAPLALSLRLPALFLLAGAPAVAVDVAVDAPCCLAAGLSLLPTVPGLVWSPPQLLVTNGSWLHTSPHIAAAPMADPGLVTPTFTVTTSPASAASPASIPSPLVSSGLTILLPASRRMPAIAAGSARAAVLLELGPPLASGAALTRTSLALVSALADLAGSATASASASALPMPLARLARLVAVDAAPAPPEWNASKPALVRPCKPPSLSTLEAYKLNNSKNSFPFSLRETPKSDPG
jgi:hypothetical protein